MLRDRESADQRPGAQRWYRGAVGGDSTLWDCPGGRGGQGRGQGEGEGAVPGVRVGRMVGR